MSFLSNLFKFGLAEHVRSISGPPTPSSMSRIRPSSLSEPSVVAIETINGDQAGPRQWAMICQRFDLMRQRNGPTASEADPPPCATGVLKSPTSEIRRGT